MSKYKYGTGTTDQPYEKPDTDTVLWRYMDFVKYVSMLSSEALFFANSSQFQDPFEGAVGAEVLMDEWKRRFREWYKDVHTPEEIELLIQGFHMTYSMLKDGTVINCWYKSKGESEAMWRLYSTDTNNAIAIRTNVGKLKASLPGTKQFEIGKVIYYDYDEPISNPNITFWFKRQSFAHEKEVRVIHRVAPQVGCNGVLIPVDLRLLIDKVYISPLASSWLLDLVKDVSLKYGFEVEVDKSEIAQLPIKFDK